MLLTAEQKCLLWLSCGEVTAGRARELAAAYGGAQGVWEAFGKVGGPRFQASARAKLERLHSRAAIENLLERLERKKVRLLFQGDAEYPDSLESLQDPPYLLYCAGRLGCLRKPAVAIIGTRRASGYGREMAQMLSRGLCEAGVCVVSGLALGIDEAAHQAALDAEGCTIGVLGSGINVPYPAEHTPMLRKIAGGIGLVLSEYPLDAEPLAYHFPHRNRIIAGLSLGVVFVEGRIKSGGMNTVSAALTCGREVFAVPGRVGAYGSEGPHAILREGARIVTCAQDILEDLGLDAPKRAASPPSELLTGLQARIVDALGVEPLSIDELSQRLSVDGATLISELGVLEILGRVSREAGNRFRLPPGQ